MIFKLIVILVVVNIFHYVENDDKFLLETISKTEFEIDDNEILDESSVIDNYYHLTVLEDFPEVCNQYNNETCGKLWFHAVNEISIRNRNRFANVNFNYLTNINEKNLELKKQFQKVGSKISLKFKKKYEKFQWKLYKSKKLRRMFKLLTTSARSKNESVNLELIKLNNRISSIYNKAEPCFDKCLEVGESGIINLFKEEKDYDKLIGYWSAWRNETGAKIRNLFIKRMNLENKAARENGHEDIAAFELSNDFEDDGFKTTVLKLYENILPLYKEIHAFVRYCLAKFYPGKFDKNGPIPAHIFGNVWAQQWTNILPLIKKCKGNFQNENNQNEATEVLSRLSVKQMFKMAERFYVSIGMFKMTDEFWERSMLTKPPGLIVDCHGSAHDFSNGFDYRTKMCTEKTIIDFTTIHHEMGHIQYYMAYRDLPVIFRGSANSGFHEAIGDTIALSVKTPEHLHKIGLISNIPDSENFDVDYLMVTALEKVVFLPFALTMDSYIWGVYNESVPPSKFNKYWWDLTERYQGIKPPIKRTENDFDPGAKFHVAFGISYIRYFISFLIQFQFYESMCDLSEYKGPLHRCDFYQSKKAGTKLLEMLSQGKKQHWKKTMKILTGTEEIKSDSLLRFFEPLYTWLKNNNKKLGIPVGW